MSLSEVRIRRSALASNFREFAIRVGGPDRVMPVVKADAYGHGVRNVVRVVGSRHPRGFAVAHAQEALALRRWYPGRILVVSAWSPEQLPAAIRAGVELVAWDADSLRRLTRTAGRVRRRAMVHIKVDTGTGRLGSRPLEARSLLRVALRSSHLRLTGVFTHFADAEDESDGFTLHQLRLLQRLTKGIPASVERHAACTAAVLRFPPTILDFARVGIGLYGLWPSRKSRILDIQLDPVLSWRTRVLQVKRVPKGTPVGYGRTFRTTRASNLAVLPVGYADGYPRAASNRGAVLVNARPCPVIGRVSMNLLVVDASRAGRVRPGTPAVLIGRQGRAEISAEALAAASGTIHYELVTRIAAHVPRVLV